MAVSSRYSLNKNKYLLEPELERLENVLMTYKDKNPRDCLMLLIALRTGARAQEILNLTRGDINIYDQCLFIRGIKGSNDREIPIPKVVFQLLEAYMKAQEVHELHIKLFPITYNRFRQIWEFYRPTHKKLHSLRHTFAIQLYKKTKDIRLLQFALGHRNITNTMIYADYMYSRDELRKFLL